MSKHNIEAIYPLSPMQQGILFHSIYNPDSNIYIVQLRCPFYKGLDVEAFKRAWQRVVDRHAILRTFFTWEGRDKPLQLVRSQVRLDWAELDWQQMSRCEQQQRLEDYLREDRNRGFELSQAPLMRFALIRLAADRHQFIWSSHHLLLDGWSSLKVIEEAIAFYEAFCRGQGLALEPPRPYRDYIGWLQRQDMLAAETFWRRFLEGFSSPTPLPMKGGVDLASTQEASDHKQQVCLPADTTAALRALAKKHELTLNTLIHGAWAILLSRYGGERDIVFGSTFSGRPTELAGIESMVGLFINTLPVRVEVAPQMPLLIWLKKLQERQVEMRQYEYSPLVEIQGWSDVPRGQPLFRTIMIFENYPMKASLRERRGDNFALNNGEPEVAESMNYPLGLMAVPGEELQLRIVYDGRWYSEAMVYRILGHLQTLLESMVAGSEKRLADLSFLNEVEQHQMLVEWNDTDAEYPEQASLHQLVEIQAARTPDALAVTFADQHLTHAQLNQRANQLAHYLRRLGVGPEVLVGICLDRSLELVVGLLGILKAGGAYVPLDPDYPSDRLAFILEDAQVSVLVTEQRLRERLHYYKAHVVCLDVDREAINLGSEENLDNGVSAESLAYVIYTSGSTGKPKGVQIEHRALVNFMHSMRQRPGLTSSDVLLAVTTLSFDIAGLEIFLPLLAGARVVVRGEEAADGKQLAARLKAVEATAMQATPATWRLLLEAGWHRDQGLKILCGGEALPRELADQLLTAGDSLWNLYGPTETTIWSSVSKVEDGGGPVNLGRPIGNTRLYLLDQQQQPVTAGVPGELHIGGDGLARGYLNQPDLTAARFIPDAFSRKIGSRMYKTGDLVQYKYDGVAEFSGRIDHQVKIRGFRIELGEIEAVLAQHPAVQTSAVVALQDERGEKRLVAYVVPAGEETITVNSLRRHLAEKLPQYMMPSAFVWLKSLPLTPNGKLDRRALPTPGTMRPELESAFLPPRTPTEEILTGVWAEVLGLEQVSIRDNFFELGGHSLLAMQVVSRLQQVLAMEMPLKSLFEIPTVEGLADYIEAAKHGGLNEQSRPIERVSREEELPLSFAQQRLWFLDQLEPGLSIYNIPTALRLTGMLNVKALEQCINEVGRRHELLRTTFAVVRSSPVQVINSSLILTPVAVDLRHLPQDEREAEVRRLAVEENQRPFDLSRGPLLRVALIQVGEQEHVLTLTMHHIVSDGWSRGVFAHEMLTLYRAFSSGRPSDLAELRIQYADFAVWQHDWLRGELLERQLSYWKRQLAGGIPPMKLPTDRPRPSVQTFRGATRSMALPQTLTDALKRLSRRLGVTLFMTLSAAFKTLLHHYSKQNDIVIGTGIANRNRVETEGLIGFFVNLLVLRTDLSGDPTFRELLGRVREVVLGAYAHQDLPFDKLVETLQEGRVASHAPLLQVLFVLQNVRVPTLELPDVVITPMEFDNGIAKFDLTVFIEEAGQSLRASLEYNGDLFEADTIAQMWGHYEALLGDIVENPNARLSELEKVLIEIEKRQGFMERAKQTEFNRKKFMSVKPKRVTLPQQQVMMDYLRDGELLPLVIRPAISDLDAADWVKGNLDLIRTKLSIHGAILFRDFNLDSVSEFERIALAICPELFADNGELPRTNISGKIYTPVDYPHDQPILWHNENTFSPQWPMKIWFFCIQPAQQGGETPIVDSRKVFDLIEPRIRRQFSEKKIMYLRNYGDGLGLTWQTVFQTTKKSDVEEFCRKHSIDFEWKDGDRLRTRSVRPAVARHPKTGETVWFNQATHWHVSCLEPAVRGSVLSMFQEEDLPRNCYYGDGSRIEGSVMEQICEVFTKAEVCFPWQKGDLLMLDNMLTAHARNPYVGPRKIAVAMGDMITDQDLQNEEEKCRIK